MLKVIKRVLRLSGDLSKRIYASCIQLYRLNYGNVPCRGCVLYPHKNTEQQSICRE